MESQANNNIYAKGVEKSGFSTKFPKLSRWFYTIKSGFFPIKESYTQNPHKSITTTINYLIKERYGNKMLNKEN